MSDTDKFIKSYTKGVVLGVGVGAILLTYSLFGRTKKAFTSGPRLSIKRTVGMRPAMTPLGGAKDTIAGGIVPALVMRYNEATDDYEFFKLNFTPRSLAEPAKSNEEADLAYIRSSPVLSFFNEGVEYFYNSAAFDKYRSDPQRMIHPVDWEILRDANIIPFFESSLSEVRVDYVPSYDGINGFILGYSKPFYASGTSGQIEVMRPLWAVSFGNGIHLTRDSAIDLFRLVKSQIIKSTRG